MRFAKSSRNDGAKRVFPIKIHLFESVVILSRQGVLVCESIVLRLVGSARAFYLADFSEVAAIGRALDGEVGGFDFGGGFPSQTGGI